MTAGSTEAGVVARGVVTPRAAIASFVPHPRPFACTVHVDPLSVNSVVGHVANERYLEWFNQAAQLHCDALGFTMERMLDDGRMWFVARHEIDYRAEALPDDRLELLTWVRSIKGVKSWRDAVLVRPNENRVICSCSTLWVFVRLETRRPCRIGPTVTEAFDPLP